MIRTLRTISLFAVAFAVAALAVGCSGGADTTGPTPMATLVRLVLTPDTVSMKVGDTTHMDVTGIMSDGTVTSAANVRLDSLYLDGTVGLVSVTGGSIQVVAMAPGSRVITAGFGGLTVSGLVVVSQPALRIRVVPSGECLRKGSTYQYAIAAIDSLGNPVQVGRVTWSVQDATVATIDGNGLLTGVGAGHTNVVAQVSGLTALGELIVDPAPVGTPMTCQ